MALTGVLLLLSWLNGYMLCAGEADEVDEFISRQCGHLTDDDALFHCAMQERKRIEIKNSLIEALNVRPLARKNLTIDPEKLREMLRKEGFAEDGLFVPPDEDDRPRPSKILPVVQDPRHLLHNRDRSFFDCSSIETSDVREAQLSFAVRAQPATGNFLRYNVHIYRFKSANLIETEPIWSYKRSRDVMLGDQFDSVDVTDLVKEWSRNPSENYGMMVKIELENSDSGEEMEEVEQASMFIEVKMAMPVSRARRTPFGRRNNTCLNDPEHRESYCCRYSMKINFSDFGWDWVLAPKSYEAYYCAGRCKLGQRRKDSHHALFLEYKRHQNMCCAPERLAEMKLVYADEGSNIQIQTISNMIVQKCGCS